MNTDHIKQAQKIIAGNSYMVVATSQDNVPWISPVFFVHDAEYNLYWVSYKEARHSQNAQVNPRAAITIFNSKAPVGEGDAVYFECSTSELSDAEEISKVMSIWNQSLTQEHFKISDLTAVTDQGVWRVYKATPYKLYKLGEGKLMNGQHIDQKVELSLLDLQRLTV